MKELDKGLVHEHMISLAQSNSYTGKSVFELLKTQLQDLGIDLWYFTDEAANMRDYNGLIS